MQTLATFLISSRLAVSLYITGSLTSLSTADGLAQSVGKQSTYAIHSSGARQQASGSVLARNAAPKNEAPATSATAKTASSTDKKVKHDSKAVGRCWNRLMQMIREARQVNQEKNK